METYAKKYLLCEFEIGDKEISIFNYHGYWEKSGKGDTPERISQSKKINEYIKKVGDDNTILCGDFNLGIETESLKILEIDLENLIRKNNIISTRTHLYDKEEKFADYVFVSKTIQKFNFNVLPDVVSDHSPLLLEVN